MTLTFTLKRQYGRDRYYPENAAARAVVDLTGRKCLNHVEIARLKLVFEIRLSQIDELTKENI